MNFEIKEISLEKLNRDPLNVRNKIPPDQLRESIRNRGYDKTKHITVWYNKDYNCYPVMDGWQRCQVLKSMECYSTMPCKVFNNRLEALEYATQESTQTELTQYETILQFANSYNLCIEKNMSPEEAIKRIINNQGISRKRLEKYLRVYNLPKPLHTLLKEKKNRNKQDLLYLSKNKYDDKINYYDKIGINFLNEIAIMTSYYNIQDDRIIELTINILGKSKEHIKKILQRVCVSPEEKISEIITEVIHGSLNQDTLHIGSIFLPNIVKEKFIQKCVNERTKVPNKIRKYIMDDIDYKTEKKELKKNNNVSVIDTWL